MKFLLFTNIKNKIMQNEQNPLMELIERVRESNKELVDSGYVCNLPQSLTWKITEIFDMSVNPQYKAGFVVMQNADGFSSIKQFSPEDNYNIGDIINFDIVDKDNSGNYGVNISATAKAN